MEQTPGSFNTKASPVGTVLYEISPTFLSGVSAVQVIITSIRFVPQQSKQDISQLPKLSLCQFKRDNSIILHHTMALCHPPSSFTVRVACAT